VLAFFKIETNNGKIMRRNVILLALSFCLGFVISLVSANESGYGLLNDAVYSGDTDVISKVLLEHPQLLTAEPSDPLNSPLAWAAAEGDEALFQFLLDKGMSLTPNDSYAHFVLTTALYFRKYGIAEIVVKTLPNVPVNVEMAASDGSEETYLFSSPLFQVSRDGNIEWVEYLLSRGASTLHGDQEWQYPLASAITGKHIEIVEKLIEYGSDVNLVVAGRSMLQRAQVTDDQALIKLLVDAGAN